MTTLSASSSSSLDAKIVTNNYSVSSSMLQIIPSVRNVLLFSLLSTCGYAAYYADPTAEDSRIVYSVDSSVLESVVEPRKNLRRNLIERANTEPFVEKSEAFIEGRSGRSVVKGIQQFEGDFKDNTKDDSNDKENDESPIQKDNDSPEKNLAKNVHKSFQNSLDESDENVSGESPVVNGDIDQRAAARFTGDGDGTTAGLVAGGAGNTVVPPPKRRKTGLHSLIPESPKEKRHKQVKHAEEVKKELKKQERQKKALEEGRDPDDVSDLSSADGSSGTRSEDGNNSGAGNGNSGDRLDSDNSGGSPSTTIHTNLDRLYERSYERSWWGMKDDSQDSQKHKNQHEFFGIEDEHFLMLLPGILGVTYVLAWTVAIYPQIISNAQNKSVKGLSIGYHMYNVVGFLCYATYCIGSRLIQDTYNLPEAVTVHDAVFSLHSLFCTLVIIGQIIVYRDSSGRNSIFSRTSAYDENDSLITDKQVLGDRQLQDVTTIQGGGSGNSSRAQGNATTKGSNAAKIHPEEFTGGDDESDNNVDQNNFRQFSPLVQTADLGISPKQTIQQSNVDSKTLKQYIAERKKAETSSGIYTQDIVLLVLIGFVLFLSFTMALTNRIPWFSRTLHGYTIHESSHESSHDTTDSSGATGSLSSRIVDNDYWSFLTILGFVKVVITFCKYPSQILLNYERKSTQGLAKLSYMLDITGGICSFSQNIVTAWLKNDAEIIHGNIPKLLNGLLVIIYVTIILIQFRAYNNEPSNLTLGRFSAADLCPSSFSGSFNSFGTLGSSGGGILYDKIGTTIGNSYEGMIGGGKQKTNYDRHNMDDEDEFPVDVVSGFHKTISNQSQYTQNSPTHRPHTRPREMGNAIGKIESFSEEL